MNKQYKKNKRESMRDDCLMGKIQKGIAWIVIPAVMFVIIKKFYKVLI